MDAPPPSWWDAVFGLLGLGGGWRLLTHEGRIRRLEDDAEKDREKSVNLGKDVSEMKGTLKSVDEGVSEIREWIMGRAK